MRQLGALVQIMKTAIDYTRGFICPHCGNVDDPTDVMYECGEPLTEWTCSMCECAFEVNVRHIFTTYHEGI